MAEIVAAEDGESKTSDESRSLALKDEGNELLKIGKFGQAAEKYTLAIEIFPTAVLYSNRAQAMIKTESYGLAISDAASAIR